MAVSAYLNYCISSYLYKTSKEFHSDIDDFGIHLLHNYLTKDDAYNSLTSERLVAIKIDENKFARLHDSKWLSKLFNGQCHFFQQPFGGGGGSAHPYGAVSLEPGRVNLGGVSSPQILCVVFKEHGIKLMSETVYIEILKRFLLPLKDHCLKI